MTAQDMTWRESNMISSLPMLGAYIHASASMFLATSCKFFMIWAANSLARNQSTETPTTTRINISHGGRGSYPPPITFIALRLIQLAHNVSLESTGAPTTTTTKCFTWRLRCIPAPRHIHCFKSYSTRLQRVFGG